PRRSALASARAPARRAARRCSGPGVPPETSQSSTDRREGPPPLPGRSPGDWRRVAAAADRQLAEAGPRRAGLRTGPTSATACRVADPARAGGRVRLPPPLPTVVAG